MDKRQFLGAAALVGMTPAGAGISPAGPAKGPTLLTVTGAIAKPNRGPFNPALDQMMHKHKVSFERAFAFDYAMLVSLPAVTIGPTIEYDARVHQLRGPLLQDVLAAAGARAADSARLVLRAVDGFAVTMSMEKARRQRLVIATQLDGHALPLGGLGPLWAIVDADRVAELAAKPLAERFGECPWGLYHIDVQP